ncbi:MAG TPA: RpiB/LacA/LacB family sugar-phosphate isomerase [Solirubrobacteraceae bacterium]|jgi:ribose 5-phosphate isomerase B
MHVAVAADELTGIAGELIGELARRGHVTVAHGALSEGERSDWAWASEAAARDVAEGRAAMGIVCCWTGTGASIAANKVRGVRAALCADAVTAAGARTWNDANVLALSLRSTSRAQLGEILDAWFATQPSAESGDAANVEHLAQIATGHGASAQLAVRGAGAAVDFYLRAFGAQEIYRVGASDEHEAVVAQLRVGGSSFWVADESPEHLDFSPETLGGATVKMLLVVDDPDALTAQAIAAGASEVRAVAEEHGWRLGRIADPFGHHWEIGRPLLPWPPGG